MSRSEEEIVRRFEQAAIVGPMPKDDREFLRLFRELKTREWREAREGARRVEAVLLGAGWYTGGVL